MAQQVLERRKGKGTEDWNSSIFFLSIPEDLNLCLLFIFNISFEAGLCLDLLNGLRDVSNWNVIFAFSFN